MYFVNMLSIIFMQVASAISALREQYKNVRMKNNPDGTLHIGTREQKRNDKTLWMRTEEEEKKPFNPERMVTEK